MKTPQRNSERWFTSLNLAPALGTFGLGFLWQAMRYASKGNSNLLFEIPAFVCLLWLFGIFMKNILEHRQEIDSLRAQIEEILEKNKQNCHTGP